MSENAEISEALMRQLLLEENPTQKITSEAIEAAGFLLRQFVVEARNRASVEAEFDTGTRNHTRKRQRTRVIGMSNSPSSDDENEESEGIRPIRSKHVLKIACELLMDFS
eukprot:scaffold4552_cov262-Chaetoceros_neogracile.AAC.6